MQTWNLNPDDEVHDLRIVRELGRGAYGRVYLAKDLAIGREVALKVIRAPAGSRERKRAQREARIVGRLKSPHVVTIHRVVEDDEREAWLLVLEYVPGGSLADLLDREERVSVPRALEFLRGIMLALDAAQTAGVVHGDVKPGNVLLESDGSIKLADFGLSWMVDDASISNTTEDGLGGTPAYMAPEVIMGERGRVHSDIWSAGVIFYRLLAGRLPFPAASLHELFFGVQNASPPAFSESMPGSVQALAMNLLEKHPADRPQSPADVLRRLDELSGKPMPSHIDLIEEPRDAIVRPKAPRLFGRETERERLVQRLEELAAGKGATMLLGGEAGIGKTALIQDLVERAGAGVAVLEVTATPLEGVLRPLVRGTRDSLSRAEGRMLDTVLTRLARDARDSLLGHATGSKAGGIAETMHQLAWGTEQFLREYGEATPLVVVIEDLHVVESEELHMLRELVRRLHDARILMLLTYRTHDVNASVSQSRAVAGYHELTTLPDVEVMDLKPLAPDAVLALLNARFPGTFVAPELAHQVVATAEGNPLFAREILHHLEEIGAVQREGSSLRASELATEIELPARFQELVSRRLAGLEENARTLLDAAAVDGRVFDGEAVAAMMDTPLLTVLRELQRLFRERHLIEPHGERYRFASKLIQTVIYDQIAPALRRAMHAGLAEYLETGEAPPDPERLGQHWERAGKPDRARPYLLLAAREAARKHLHRKALDLVERARWDPAAVGEAEARSDPETLLELGKTLVAVSRFADAEAVFRALETHAPDEKGALTAAVERFSARFLVDGPDAVDDSVLERAVAVVGEPVTVGRALKLRALVAVHADRLAQAAELLDDAAAVLRRADERYSLAGILLARAPVSARSGLPEEAERTYDEAATIFDELGHEGNASVCQVNKALSRIQRGEIGENIRALETAFRIFQLGGWVAQAIQTGCHLAHLHYALGDLAAAFAALAEARELIGSVDNQMAQIELHTTQMSLLLAQGQLPAARRHAESARGKLGRSGKTNVEVALDCFDAQWRTVSGAEGAADAAQRAIAAARASESARTRHYPAGELALFVPFGLDAAVFPEDEEDEMLATLYRGVRAFADPNGSPADLDRAIAVCRPAPQPWRDAEWRICVGALAAEAAARRSESTLPALREGLDASERLGHVWWQAYFLRALAVLDDAPDGNVGDGNDRDWAQRLDRLVFRIADHCDDPSEKRRIVQKWSAG